jgi:hypothetical protein
VAHRRTKTWLSVVGGAMTTKESGYYDFRSHRASRSVAIAENVKVYANHVKSDSETHSAVTAPNSIDTHDIHVKISYKPPVTLRLAAKKARSLVKTYRGPFCLISILDSRQVINPPTIIGIMPIF